jgi:hypothetical protein
MHIEDQIECLVDIFYKNKNLHLLIKFIEKMENKYPNFIVRSSLNNLADYVIAKTIVDYGADEVDAKVEVLSSFFNSFSANQDEETFLQIAQSFYIYLSQVARNCFFIELCISNFHLGLASQDLQFGFKLSSSLKFESTLSPKLHYLVALFAAMHSFDELRRYMIQASATQKILEQVDDRNVPTVIPLLKTLLQKAKLKIKEFLEASQYDGKKLFFSSNLFNYK